ncbi:MAG: tetratricopeptide repeat protein [Candidatus Obscuribacterales bacterium]|nr:tetratricopeptide repeat protein [Candidatus Obscuribacterales bacterium]
MISRSTISYYNHSGRHFSGLGFALMALSLTFASMSITTPNAYATKLNATPLPSKKDLQDPEDGQKVDIPLSGTRWKRKADYREEDKAKEAKKAEDAKKAELEQKQAGLDALKARENQGTAILKQKAAAIEENNKGVTFGQQGHWLEAIQAHEKAMQMDPTNKDFRVNLSAARTTYGQQLMAQNNLTSALSLFRKALIAAPDNGLAGKSLVNALKKAGFNPSDPNTRIKLGDQLVEANDLEGAYIEYNAALQLEPSAKSYVKMGDISLRYGSAQGAYSYYRQAISKDPDSGDAHRQLGLLQMATRDNTGAAASLRKAIILNANDTNAGAALVELWRKQVATAPNVAENHIGLAGALQLTNDFVGAESEYRRVQSIDPQNSAFEMGMNSLHRAMNHQVSDKHKAAAETLAGQGLGPEALSEINQAVLAEPKNASYQFLYGRILEMNHDLEGARKAYLTTVLLDPHNAEAAARLKQLESGGGLIGGNDNGAQQQQLQQQRQLQQQQQQMQQAQLQQQQAQQMQQQQSQQQQQPPVNQPQLPQGMPPGYGQPTGNNDVGTGSNKNVFEGGAGAPTLPNNQLAFRTHDESPEAVQAAQSRIPISANNPFAAGNRPPQNAAPATPNPTGNEILAKVAQAEASGDYATAIGIIQQILPANMQNPQIHWRLARDFISANKLEEAIPEFRLASALAPKNQDYSNDLNHALTLRKQQMHASGGTIETTPPNDTGVAN